MQPTCSRRLRADEFGNLQLSLRVNRTNGDLELAAVRRTPGVIPDHPRVRRHRGFEFTRVPCFGRIEADFNFADRIRPAEGDATESLFRASECLIVTGRIDAGKNLDRPVISPSFALPVAALISGIGLDFHDPFHVFDAVESWDE